MTEQTPGEAYIERCLIDLSKKVTAAEKRIKQLEKGYQDLLTLDDPMLMKMIAKACLAGAIDAEGKYCFVPPFSLGEKKDA